jgi:hypothetical protein
MRDLTIGVEEVTLGAGTPTWTMFGAAADMAAAMNDLDDSTGVQELFGPRGDGADSGDLTKIRFHPQPYAPAEGDYIWGVRWWAQMETNANPHVMSRFDEQDAAGNWTQGPESARWPDENRLYFGPWQTTNPYGDTWDDADMQGPALALLQLLNATSDSSHWIKIYRFGWHIRVYRQPTASNIAPVDVTASRPTVSFDVTDPDVLESGKVTVYRGDPADGQVVFATSDVTWTRDEDGTITGGSAYCGETLMSGVDYTAQVTLYWQPPNAGSGASTFYGAPFTLTPPDLPTPALTVRWDELSDAVWLDVASLLQKRRNLAPFPIPDSVSTTDGWRSTDPDTTISVQAGYLRATTSAPESDGPRIDMTVVSAIPCQPGDQITASLDARTSMVIANLLPDPSFEADADEWTAQNATLDRLPDEAHTGLRALRLTTTASGPGAYHALAGLAANTAYTFTAWMLVPASSSPSSSSSYHLRVGGTGVAASANSASAPVGAGWVQLTVAFTTTATPTPVTVYLFGGDLVGDVAWVDDVSVTADDDPGGVQMTVQFYDADGVYLAGSASTGDTVQAPDWTRVSRTVQAPLQAFGWVVGLKAAAVATAGDWVDVRHMMGGTGDYFDGDFAYAVWDGTPGESTSTMYPARALRIDRSVDGGDWTPTPIWSADPDGDSFQYADQWPPAPSRVCYRATMGVTDATAIDSGPVCVRIPTPTEWSIRTRDGILLRPSQVIAEPEYAIAEQTEVLRPLGRTGAVVVSSGIGGDDFNATIHAAGDEFARTRDVIRRREALWIRSPWGWARWLRPTTRSYVRAGAGAAGRGEFAVETVEVSDPILADTQAAMTGGIVPATATTVYNLTGAIGARIGQLATPDVTAIQGLYVDEAATTWATQTTAATEGTATETTLLARFRADGSLIDYMTLTDGGHGIAFAVDANGRTPMVYFAWQYGNSDLVRFPYIGGGTIAETDASVETVWPGPVGWWALNPAADRFAIRDEAVDGSATVHLRRWTDVLAGIDEEVGSVVLPASVRGTHTFQGIACDDTHLLELTGMPNGDPATITAYRWTDGGIAEQRDLTVFTDSYSSGEPEGISFSQATGAAPALIVGIAAGDRTTRQQHVYRFA